ncbi:MAG: carbohydrate ABC transporter permease [Verrucomicrobia bacterium]|nr:carbohydrate ABC transporter permease [Verrucomicrobiota bacterium]MBV9129053.1 carbohydrate ABC transporter permease [Verrucomicrobiota bacterium]MBV9643568.1 carbohydrate ABC transporter permease [Verrucomicrobiota bacterium]
MDISLRPPSNLGRWCGYLVLALFAAVSLGPIWIAVKTALSDSRTLFSSASSFLPQDPTLFNLQRVLGLVNPADPRLAQMSYGKIDFYRALVNSVIFTLLAVIPQIACSALAAYAFARLRFTGSRLVFSLFLSATMIPSVVLFIPNFILIKDLGWLNTFQGMAAPYALMTPFAVFFLRQMFLSTPRELEECALVDGASYLSIFFRIVLPLHRSALATLTIITSLSAWNEFFWPFLVGRSEPVRVMSVAINAFRQQQAGGTPDWSGLMACTVLGIVPIAILLVLFGRKVVESFQYSGPK